MDLTRDLKLVPCIPDKATRDKCLNLLRDLTRSIVCDVPC